jgi:hypothetical protein
LPLFDQFQIAESSSEGLIVSDYVTNLEVSLRNREDECLNLRNQLEAHRAEINELRGRLGMPSLPPPPPESGLGLVVNQNDWDDVKAD